MMAPFYKNNLFPQKAPSYMFNMSLIMIPKLTAPVMMRNISHLYPHITTFDGFTENRDRDNSGQNNIARKPVSRSCDSQPRK